MHLPAKNHAHTIIISDVHLGHPKSLAELLRKTLMLWSFEVLIILGDLYHRKTEIPDSQWPLIEYLRENRHAIIYIDGNHDPIGDALVDDVLGIEVKKEHSWEINGTKFCALHGHQFDGFLRLFSFAIWDRIFHAMCLFLKRREIKKTWASTCLEKLYHRFCDRIANKALRYARRKRRHVIFCGHKHKADKRELVIKRGRKKGQKVLYYNSGSWQGDKDPSFITIDHNGAVTLHCMQLSPQP